MIVVVIIVISVVLLFIIYKMFFINSEKFIKDLIEKNTPLRIIYENDINKSIENDDKNNIIVINPQMFEKIALNGEIGLSESYMNGDWHTKNLEYIVSTLLKKQDVLVKSLKSHSLNFIFMEIKAYLKNCFNTNTIQSSKKNIEHHYDIGNDLYSKMLGKHMQYTCAYFNKPNMTLDEAQYEKMELIAKKLDLKQGMEVLDIGCGFGSLAKHLAEKYKVNVIGVTLSKEQKKYSDEFFSDKNVTIMIKDYRHVQGKFDRVYSVGMFEHVGRKNYKEYYDKCYELLKDDGIMLLHTISTTQRNWNHNTFVGKYIFPEFELPHIENLTQKFTDKWHMEDWQNFGLSYAKTLRAWKTDIGDWSKLEKYDKNFRRMWDMYLLGCAASFQNRVIGLWQIVYTKKNSSRLDDCHHIRK